MAAVDFLPFVLILVAFYLLIIRPARNRQRAAMQLQERLTPGVEVMTTSGMYGTVVSVDDDTLSLEIAPGTTVRFAKAAVGQVRSIEDSDGVGPEPDVPGAPATGPEGDSNDTEPRDDRRTR